ncbi:hypothetical protein BEH94_01200 [Candidatus Altiarchaeales archaeon WOR_SM1_SCG]|nr:hypothetical protein BEH94_01200 [Candidatus Altiarchaeales archaeon WOR_SM1_SCG]
MTAGANSDSGCDEAWAWGHYYDNEVASSDFDRECVIINRPYLVIEKFTIPATLAIAKPGDTVQYRIRLTNPNSAKADAKIRDITDDVQYGHTITTNGTGTAAAVPYNFTVNLTTDPVKFTPDAGPIILSPGEELILYFNTSVSSAAYDYDCDKASYNATDKMNNSILRKYAEKCITVLKPGAGIRKLSDARTAEPGSEVEFTLMLENNGKAALYNVTVNDTMSPGWEFLEVTQSITGMNESEQSSAESSTNNIIIFGNITLNAGEKKTIKYTARVTDNASGGINENCANITGYDNTNTGYTDEYCITITVYKPALEIVKDVSQHDVEPGSEPLITIIIENPTYATVYNITITEFLPRGFNYTDGTAKLDGRKISDPNWTGIREFECGSNDTGQLNLTWNFTNTNFTDTDTEALVVIPPKTTRILTFRVHVKCNVQNTTFNNTVSVSGYTGAGAAVGPNSTSFEMRGYIADAELYKYASTNSPTFFEYIDYMVVIWNNPAGANIAPLTLADTMPPYIKYVPGYTYVGDLKIEPTVCGDYTDKAAGNYTAQYGGNCSDFHGELLDGNSGDLFNVTGEQTGDGMGEILFWNLSKWLFLTPGQQVSIKYRAQVIPGVGSTARNNVTLSYLDPEHPELCPDCEFNISSSTVIAIAGDINLTNPTELNYTLKLEKGWNLISIPIQPDDTSIFSILAPVQGKYIDVAAWNNRWQYRSYAYGDWFGDLAEIEPKKGYWLNMKEADNLTISGKTINEFNITLYRGWNLIGWPSTTAVPVQNLTLTYIDLATWEGRWNYRSYAYGDWFGDLSEIKPGKGYWINIPRNDTIAA